MALFPPRPMDCLFLRGGCFLTGTAAVWTFFDGQEKPAHPFE
jgi:hypothetical protein